jgi:hypothetical protein
MNYYEEPYARDARLTVSSVLLLAIFISAVAFIAVAAIWQPWDGESEPAVTAPIQGPFPEEPVVEEAAPGVSAEDGAEVAAQP